MPPVSAVGPVKRGVLVLAVVFAAALGIGLAVNAWAAIRGSTDAERAALYADQGSDPTAGVGVTCGQRWLRPAALIGRVTYQCTHWGCERNEFGELSRKVEIGRSTISHTPLDGWHYVLHGPLRDQAVANSGSTEPYNQTDSC